MIFEVLIAVSVKKAVVFVATPRRLIEIYHPFFSTMELEVVVSTIFMVATESVASSKTFVSFYQISYHER